MRENPRITAVNLSAVKAFCIGLAFSAISLCYRSSRPTAIMIRLGHGRIGVTQTTGRSGVL
ncbi:hypothetical protein PGT21_023620 [Puccinia graminis f. sp. tritici]|uniref:Uncharacterized protein n=1 Tax=Puccinia graminis f. sp. tritici TaxID=56615 RepID=A0A5B0S4M2_PUCGR|nr:hypothetical protein PGT21_023620 [Puccinia graminis f. sp. tritici]KAA1132777.1 hypothetical protein PGTUg99_011950 [Puccinia graminis f. sp. tritici]